MNDKETLTEEQLIRNLKQETEKLWSTIQEAKKSNLKVQVGFDDYLIEPEIRIFKELY